MRMPSVLCLMDETMQLGASLVDGDSQLRYHHPEKTHLQRH